MLKNKIIANRSRTGNNEISFNEETLPNNLTDESVMADKFRQEEIREILNTPLLTLREQSIIVEHFGFEREAMSAKEIAENLHLTDKRIRQIIEQAFEKLSWDSDIMDRLTYLYPLETTKYSERIEKIKEIEKILENKVYGQMVKEILPKYIGLDSNNRIKIITMFYGLDGTPKPIEVIAEELGWSVEKVAITRMQALRRLNRGFLDGFNNAYRQRILDAMYKYK